MFGVGKDICIELVRYIRDIKREIPKLADEDLEYLLDCLERIKRDIDKLENIVLKILEAHKQLRELEFEEESILMGEEIRKA